MIVDRNGAKRISAESGAEGDPNRMRAESDAGRIASCTGPDRTNPHKMSEADEVPTVQEVVTTCKPNQVFGCRWPPDPFLSNLLPVASPGHGQDLGERNRLTVAVPPLLLAAVTRAKVHLSPVGEALQYLDDIFDATFRTFHPAPRAACDKHNTRWFHILDITLPRRAVYRCSGCVSARSRSSARTSTARAGTTCTPPCHIEPPGCGAVRSAPCGDPRRDVLESRSSVAEARARPDLERRPAVRGRETPHATSSGAKSRFAFRRSDRRQPSGGVILSPHGAHSK